MPGKVKIQILAGRNLPVMDKTNETSDAYVEVKLGGTTCKTDVCRKSLNPVWNSEWFKFEVDDEELQDEPLQIRIMDYDTYSANDAIGKVYINLNPLLLSSHSGCNMAGWIPIYDTMHGIRGEININVKVDYFSDFNRFRQSSCGVPCYYCPGIPHGHRLHIIHGFVEELVANEDPEYHWMDKLRTPRASNEARQTVFAKLSGEVQRKIGLKTLELGGNAIIGYRQCFDLEGEAGVTVRGIGTAVTLVRHVHENLQLSPCPPKDPSQESPLPDESPGSPITHIPNKLSQSPIKCNVPCICRRSSDTELNVMAKGPCGSNGTTKMMSRSDNMEMLEYPFLSMRQFPSSFIIHLGGVVAAQSVKLLGRVNNPEELESRDAWWKEIRMEIRSHARALGCNVVLGYSEATSICDDVCILSATGTAAVVCMYHSEGENLRKEFSSLMSDKMDDKSQPGTRRKHLSDGDEHGNSCRLCHIPYSEASIPFAVLLSRCAICRKSKVPDVLFTTISPPASIPINGRGGLIQARVCKGKKEGKGEFNAKEISDSLPFLQYELHRQLLNKLKMKAMNGLFELRIQISVSARMIIAIATATAVFLTALPPQLIPQVSSGTILDDTKIQTLKRQISDTVKKNCEFYNILQISKGSDSVKSDFDDDSDEDDDEEELSELDLNAGNKDACILEMDDAEDADLISFLVDPNPPEGFEVVNTERVPGFDTAVRNLQMFTRIFRTKFSSGNNLTCRQLTQYCESALQSLFFKLRKMIPCSLCNLQFRIELPEDDEIQLTLLGMALGLGNPSSIRHKIGTSLKSSELGDGEMGNEDMSSKSRSTMDISDKKLKYHTPIKERYGVDITPLSYIPGIPIERYLGNLNFFFIRESTSIKEFGGMSGFVQSFIADALAIARAHVVALGGNALVSYFLNEYVLLQNPHKNQGQCLINFGGDVVQVSNPASLCHSSSVCTLMPLKGNQNQRLFFLKRKDRKKAFNPLGFLTP